MKIYNVLVFIHEEYNPENSTFIISKAFTNENNALNYKKLLEEKIHLRYIKNNIKDRNNITLWDRCVNYIKYIDKKIPAENHLNDFYVEIYETELEN